MTKDEQIKLLTEALEICLPIVSAAYWDHHTAGTMPGAGYSRKIDRLVSDQWGWRDSKVFTTWLAKVKTGFQPLSKTEKESIG